MPSASATDAWCWREHAAPRAFGRAGVAFDRLQLRVVDGPSRARADRLEHRDNVQSSIAEVPRKNRAAVDEDHREVEPGAAMSIPGSDLSHPARPTKASKRSACIMTSTESAMISRLTSDACIPSFPIEDGVGDRDADELEGEPTGRTTPSLAR